MDEKQAIEIASKWFPDTKIEKIQDFNNYFVIVLENKGSRMDLVHIIEKTSGKLLPYDPITLKNLKGN